MTACIPDDPIYCFCPVSDADGEPPQIRILGRASPISHLCNGISLCSEV